MEVNDKVLEIMCDFVTEAYNLGYYGDFRWNCNKFHERVSKSLDKNYCENWDCDDCPFYSTSNMMKWLKGLSEENVSDLN